MSELLTTRRLSIVPTLRCTLNCKLCSNHMPDFKEPYDVTYGELIRDIDYAFDLFDRIEWLQFVGGEIFLNKSMADIYRYCHKHKNKFEKLIIETNATIMPSAAEISALREHGESSLVMVSDYGKLSANRNNLILALEENGIPYRLKKYFGEIDEQHIGGWLDNTGLRDYNETAEQVETLSANCAQVRLENMHIFRGKLHRCSNSLFMTELGILTPNKNDYVDLNDPSLTREEKREIVSSFYTYARKSCRYCTWKNGDDPAAKRYIAAEQLPRKGYTTNA